MMIHGCPTGRDLVTTLARASLRAFLDAGCRIDCTPSGPPRVSVLVVLWNRAELTLSCIQSLLSLKSQTPFELILVDNGSQDDTARLLDRIDGATILRNESNLGYPTAVNQAARAAVGDYLLLLNNDTQVLGRSLDAAVELLDASPDIGGAGGKLILLDGTLQEAGCGLVREGYQCEYGRGDSPDLPEYQLQRDVDYCSGAFFLTRRLLFEELGGLDEAYSPGYFEDPDYAIRLWTAGWRVVYCPDICVLHYENASSPDMKDTRQLIARNQALFNEKHRAWIRDLPTIGYPLATRASHDISFKALLLVDGFLEKLPAEIAMECVTRLTARFRDLGGWVTLCLLRGTYQEHETTFGPLVRTVELVCPESSQELARLLHTRRLYYDIVVLTGDEEVSLVRRSGISESACVVWRDETLVKLSGLKAA